MNLTMARGDIYPGMIRYYDAAPKPTIKITHAPNGAHLALETENLVTYTYEELEEIMNKYGIDLWESQNTNNQSNNKAYLTLG